MEPTSPVIGSVQLSPWPQMMLSGLNYPSLLAMNRRQPAQRPQVPVQWERKHLILVPDAQAPRLALIAPTWVACQLLSQSCGHGKMSGLIGWPWGRSHDPTWAPLVLFCFVFPSTFSLLILSHLLLCFICCLTSMFLFFNILHISILDRPLDYFLWRFSQRHIQVCSKKHYL